MTIYEARQRFDFRWTVLSTVVMVPASLALLRPSPASSFFPVMCGGGVAIAGYLASRRLSRPADADHIKLSQRLRLLMILGVFAAAIILFRNVPSVLMLLGALGLWSICVNVAVQIGVRYPISHKNLLYVQFVADLWVALFLMFVGANWLVIAGVLTFAACTARVADASDQRLLVLQLLASAALLVVSAPIAARAFSVYLFVVVAIAAWSSHHLLALATYLHSVTVSASGESISR
jgi:hypothetical protein